jgi:hypothetical protein
MDENKYNCILTDINDTDGDGYSAPILLSHLLQLNKHNDKTSSNEDYINAVIKRKTTLKERKN